MIAQFNPNQSRRWIWTATVLALLGGVALTDSVRAKDPSAPSTKPSTQPAVVESPIDGTQGENDLQSRLATRIGDIDWDGVPFNKAVEELRQKSGANVVVAWRALEAAGIDKAAEVSLRLKNVTLRQALDHALSDIGGGQVRLEFAIQDGAILVSTEEEISRYVKTAVYDVHDLIQEVPNKPREQWSEPLIKTIEHMVAADTWKDNDRTISAIRELNGKLIIQQTPANHEKVAEFLKMLEDKQQQANAAQSSAQAVPQAVPAGFNPPPGGPQALFGGIPAAPGPMPTPPRTVVYDSEIEARNQAAVVLLKKVLPEVKFDAVALSDVIDFLRDVTGGNIVVNWKTLEEAGIDKNAQVTLQMKNTPFESVLAATLRQAGGQKLALVIDRGIITITTQYDVPGYMLTKAYNVKDLAASPQEMNDLVNVVQNLTQTQDGGTVQAFNKKLVITATARAHEQVEKLLEDLKSGATTQPAAEAPTIEQRMKERRQQPTGGY
jgi:hypothetical protein